MTDYIDQVFGPGGILASEFPNYEARQGQIDLARAVDQALRDGRHLIGEGPCGTGKSLAYGVPAVWHSIENRKRMSAFEAELEAYEAKWPPPDPFSDEAPDDGRPPPPEEPPPHRVVIATANINLQEQLTKKDLPLLQRLLPWKFSFALYKGRSHYLCEDRFRESQAKGHLPGGGLKMNMGHSDELVQLVKWHGETNTGDESELSFVPDSRNWAMMSVGSDDCLGVDCEFAKRKFQKQTGGGYVEVFGGPKCFANEAKARAQAADIVVTNFHMLFAHVGVSMATEGQAQLLPEFAYLIVDEAHELADVARQFFGFQRSANSVKRLGKRMKEWAGTAGTQGGNKLRIVDQLEDATDKFFEAITDFSHSAHYDGRIKPGQLAEWADPGPILEGLRAIGIEAEERAENELLPKRERTKASRVFRQAMKASEDIAEAFEASNPDRVYNIEEERKVVKLCARVVNVGPIISDELFGKMRSACLVSATLTTNGNFGFAKKETGLEGLEPIEIVADSPFNFEEQALLILPAGMPDPKSEDFPGAATDVFDRVIEHFKGRTLGLFTSYKNLKAVAERLRSKGVTVLVQGEKPRHELARIFREDVSSVLLGTSSFWTGIDVPGESLSAVIIDKLPFPAPGDPVVAAIAETDPKFFFNFMIPRATIQLRQGVGRLIRSKTDTGIVVILDPRIADKSYGKHFRRSLPSMRLTRDLENIAVFMSEANEWVLSR